MAKDILKEITAKKRERLALAKQAVPEEEKKAQAVAQPAARPFFEAVCRPKQISLIAEIKKQSPSAGPIVADFSAVAIASKYKQAGAQALSVVTEEDFFAGEPDSIRSVKESVDLPVLRKDFILEPYQIYESRALGADAVLLIAELLSKDSIVEMVALCHSLGMGCLVESHSEKELKKVLGIRIPLPEAEQKNTKKKGFVPFLIGINNRDLRTLETDLKTTERLYPLVPKDRPVVVESGIKSYQDILFLKVLGVGAVLVGEALLRSPDITEATLDLMGW
jgi:indole-3-glycerol phosphate synthase